MAQEELRKRLPSVPRKISEIAPEDIRVQILATVVDSKESIIVIDDGTAKINVSFPQPQKTGPGNLVRVFGRVIPVENGFELSGEILQDMGRLDLELARKVEEIEKRLGV